MFSLDENKSTRNDNFDADEFLRKAIENGGMIEKAVETEVKADDGRVILYATRGKIKKLDRRQ